MAGPLINGRTPGAVACQRRAVHVHHLAARSAAPSLVDDQANVIGVCAACHDWIHAQPLLARRAGLSVPSWMADPPAARPVRTPAPAPPPVRPSAEHPSMTPPGRSVTMRDMSDAEDAGTRWTWTLRFPSRPPLNNELLRLDAIVRGAQTREWRQAASLIAGRRHERFAWAIVEVEVDWAGTRLPDTDSTALVVKAVIDGIVAGGVLPGDSGRHVRAVTYWPPVAAPRYELRVSLTGSARER